MVFQSCCWWKEFAPQEGKLGPGDFNPGQTTHCTLHTAHCTLHNTHYIMHTTQCTLHIAPEPPRGPTCPRGALTWPSRRGRFYLTLLLHTHTPTHTAHYTLHTIHCTLYTAHYILHISTYTSPHPPQQPTLHTIQFTLYIAHYSRRDSPVDKNTLTLVTEIHPFF